MFFKTLLNKWLDSLEVFKKKNLYLFFLVSLNTLKRSIFILVKKFWWLFLFFLFFNLYVSFFKSEFLIIIHQFLFSVIICFFYFISFLVVRPTIEKKDFDYFGKYFPKFFSFLFIILFILRIPIIPIFWMYSLFYLDSKGGIEQSFFSLRKAFQVVFYYFPAFLIFGFGEMLLNYLLCFFNRFNAFITAYFLWNSKFLIFTLNQFIFLIVFFAKLFFVCVLSLYYTREKHKDFNFFFSEEK
ncbi:hypothetical protein KAT08_00245 [Candidatus Babeliales bacterium]|nr:hypothetical protein [Candidatus Babeliales bacterium]